MPKRKKRQPYKGWVGVRYVGLPREIAYSDSYLLLPPTAVKIFEYFCAILAARNIFVAGKTAKPYGHTISEQDIRSFTGEPRFGIPSKTTFYGCLKALEDEGFIDLIKEGKTLNVKCLSRRWAHKNALRLVGPQGDWVGCFSSHLPLPMQMVKSRAYQDLRGSSCRVLRFMLFEVSKLNIGPKDLAFYTRPFIFTYRQAAKLHVSAVGFKDAVRQLVAAGFLDIQKLGERRSVPSARDGMGAATSFRLSERWKLFGLPEFDAGDGQLERSIRNMLKAAGMAR